MAGEEWLCVRIVWESFATSAMGPGAFEIPKSPVEAVTALRAGFRNYFYTCGWSVCPVYGDVSGLESMQKKA